MAFMAGSADTPPSIAPVKTRASPKRMGGTGMHHRIKRVATALALGAVLTGAVTVPALGAEPVRRVISLDSEWLEDYWSYFLMRYCYLSIDVDAEGTLIVHEFTDRAGEFKRAVSNVRMSMTFTNPLTGGSVLLKEAGANIMWIDPEGDFTPDGDFMIAYTGRNLTDTGVIGRTVMNMNTGDAVSIAGNGTFSILDQVCPLLT
jgi:hypothetical protein